MSDNGFRAPAVEPIGPPPSGGSSGTKPHADETKAAYEFLLQKSEEMQLFAGSPPRSQHRFLFDKAALIRSASAACVEHPDDETKRQYLRGLADACHGTTDAETARAIHVARCIIIATKEGTMA